MKIFKFLFITFLLLVPYRVLQASEDLPARFNSPPIYDENITLFKTEVDVEESGHILVKETILYNFRDQQRHGIFREITRTKENIDGEKFTMDIDVLSVTDQNGNPYKYEESSLYKNGERYISLKIGDADIYVTGQNYYIIQYRVAGAISYFSEFDELYWNSTGNEWDVQILNSVTTIKLPLAAIDAEVVCYTGYTGSTESNCEIDKRQSNIGIETEVLYPGEGLTFAVKFPKGYVQELLIKPASFADNFPNMIAYYIFLAAVILLAVGYLAYNTIYPIILFWNWLKERRFIKDNKRVVAAWFEPPEDKEGSRMSPATVSLLTNRKVGIKEVSATLIDLAIRGYIKIDATKKSDIKIRVGENTDTKGLTKFETGLLDMIYESKKSSFEGILGMLSTVLTGQAKAETQEDPKKQEYTLKKVLISTFSKEVFDYIDDSGLFNQTPSKVTKKFDTVGGVSMFFMSFIAGLAAFIFGKKTWNITDIGVQKLSEGISLKNFLSSQEEQLNFQSKNQMFFEKLLPYATAFGVEKIWADKFKDIEMNKPDWYEGDFVGARSLYLLDRSLNSNVKSANYQSRGYSSSGFSSGFSGGSSGGGGGGGGGGSW